MSVMPQTIDQIRKMQPGAERVEAISRYIRTGEEKIREARRLRDSDVRELVKTLGPTKTAEAVGLGIHTVKAIARGAT